MNNNHDTRLATPRAPRRRRWQGALPLLLALLPALAQAQFEPTNQDIDLFMVNPAKSSARPNVLILLDNTANWNQAFTNEKAALASVVLGLSEQFNVGLMMFPETGAPNDNVDGGYVRFAVRQMGGDSAARLAQLITEFDKLDDKGNNATFSLLMYEAYAYYAGMQSRAGHGKIKRDAFGNTLGNTYTNVPAPIGGHAFASMLSRTYVSPITDACQRNYIIVISNGPATDNSSSLATAQSLLQGLIGAPPQQINIASPDDGSENNWIDEYAKHMAEGDCHAGLGGDQYVYTYTVEVDPGNRNQDRAHTKLMKSAASHGKGRYFAVSSGSGGVEIVDTLNEIFNEIQAVNSVFAATTLPVSVNVRGTNANQVYMGVFRPDGFFQPRWYGNLKLYKVGIDETTSPPELFLADAAGVTAENETSGFIRPGARSFWTTASDYWAFLGSYDPSDLGQASDSPDGPIVEKGGSAQQQRAASPATRALYTCTGACSSGDALSSYLFATSNSSITAAALGAANASERADIIDWVRGADLDDENSDGSTSDMRASVHGDVLHSQPAVVNYNRSGADDDNDVVVFYGANDGVLRAVTGGFDSDGGEELWGFVAPEHFGKLKTLRDNGPAIGGANKKPYFFDGTLTVYAHDIDGDGRLRSSDNDLVLLFVSMRRGGRMLYAFDVSNPDAPRFLWKRGCPNENDNTGCSSGFSELGQTWSEPVVTFLRATGDSTPVLVIGAGYDAAVEDVPPCLMQSADSSSVTTSTGGTVTYALDGSCSVSGGTDVTINRTQGRGVLVLNALTGALLWRVGPDAGATVTVADMDYSIPGEVVALNRDRDSSARAIVGKENILPGYVDRLYATDTGGNVWRIDVSGNSTADWRVAKLASLGGSGPNLRKFMHRVDVVYSEDGLGKFDAILLGSGDREHPFDQSVQNRFYMIKDRDVAATTPATTRPVIEEDDLYDATENCAQQGCVGQTATEAQAAILQASGWFFDLLPGEKVVNPATTVAGSTFFSTNQPDVDACGSNLGFAREYQIDYKYAGAVRDRQIGDGVNADDRWSEQVGGGFPPEHQPFLIDFGDDANPNYQQGVVSGADVDQLDTVPFGARLRTFWQKILDW